MWLFSKRARLLRLVESLAIYNDKGVAWGNHTSHQADAVRAAKIAELKSIVEKLGIESLPSQFVEAVESGALAVDSTGRFIDLLESHFRRSTAA